jgi:hypothetical protein
MASPLPQIQVFLQDLANVGGLNKIIFFNLLYLLHAFLNGGIGKFEGFSLLSEYLIFEIAVMQN